MKRGIKIADGIVVQSLGCIWLFSTPWTAACQAPLYFIISQVCSNSCPLSKWCYLCSSSSVTLFSFCLQSFPASGYFPVSQLFPSGSQRIGTSASASVLPMISFRIDWFDLLAVQGTLKSLLQHHCSKASILRHSAFFIVQLSHPYITTAKTIALTRWTFVGKVMSLLFNMLSRLVITFPRSKCLLISWL